MRKTLVIVLVSAIGIVTPGVAVSAATINGSTNWSAPNQWVANKLTVGQRNALAKAKEYLAYSAFSRKGLIEQLKFEGFSSKDATYGADHAGANWNTQAYKKAKDYLSYSSFSRSGLLDQLIFEGFTKAQAQYGVKKAYR